MNGIAMRDHRTKISVRNWSEWRSDMFRMLDEARGASA